MISGKQYLWAAAIAVLIATVAYPTSVHALRSTKQESFTDPDYLDYRPKNVVLMVITEDTELRHEIEKRLTKELKKNGVSAMRHIDLFPPTRQWTEEAQNSIYEREEIDSGLIVTVGASSSSVIPIATQTYSSGTVFGSYTNSSFNGNFNGSSISYNRYSAKSKAQFSAVLLDIGANRVAWYGDIFSKASGTAIVGLVGDAKAAVKGVVKGLTEKGHIQRAK